MSGFNFIADTNVLIKLGQGNEQIADLLASKNISISIITEMEILAWPQHKPAEIVKAKSMINQFSIVGLNEYIKDQAILIRRQTKMKLPDAIIASTALFLGYPLLLLMMALSELKS
jgi:predicted nucleic acid-binding protein